MASPDPSDRFVDEWHSRDEYDDEASAARGRKWTAATELPRGHNDSGLTQMVRVEPHTRLFRVSDELAAKSLLDWSEPVCLKLESREDGTYELVAKTVKRGS